MPFSEADLLQLLESQFDRIESLWEADPYRELLVWAVTIKQFMKDRAIGAIAEGVEAFKRFKQAQAEELRRLGFGAAPLASPRLAPQVA